MEDIEVLTPHLIDSVSDDGCKFVGISRIPCPAVRYGGCHQQAMAVLMLQSLTVEGGASSGSSHQEATRTRVSSAPYLVTNTLEAEHRVEGVEWKGG